MNLPVVIAFAAAAVSGALAAIVALGARRSVSHWSFVAGLALLAVESLCRGWAIQAGDATTAVAWHQWQVWWLAVLPGVWWLFSLSYARGNAAEFLRRWRAALAVAFGLPVAVVAVWFDSVVVAAEFVAELQQWVFLLGAPGLALHLLWLVGVVVTLMNLERTFRAAVGTMRWRIKYMVLGLGTVLVVRLYTSSQALLFRHVNTGLETIAAVGLMIGCGLMARGVWRTRQTTVDVYPSQSVIQGSLTVLLAGVYLVVVGLFAKWVERWGGDAAFTLKAFLVLAALVLLALLLLSDQVQLYKRRLISRHFQRPLHDYRRVWQTFAEGTLSQVEAPALCQATVKLVADVFQALSVTLWLTDPSQSRLRFGASTSLTDTTAAKIDPPLVEALTPLREQPDPFDLDAARGEWADALRRCQPGEFRRGGRRVCAPLVARGQLLGVLLVADRVGGVEFGQQDLDLFKCVAGHVAASLLTARLSQDLLKAKEFEAFQTMSAFFVHDLKNTASMLSLMLQNLPAHFDDPEFREDALRGIGKTVRHLDQLIGRLNLLRRELKLQPVETDLNEIVTRSLEGWEQTAGMELTRELQPVPRVRADPEQLGKVLTNLVLNARDAVAPAGKVRVATRQENGSAVIEVSDTGCGISPEFLEKSLFRPFQTTKKGGLGIGMFQSKMIVEAHGGRIEVASALGKGSTFRVVLPLPADQA